MYRYIEFEWIGGNWELYRILNLNGLQLKGIADRGSKEMTELPYHVTNTKLHLSCTSHRLSP